MRGKRGATATEYGLIGALIAVVCIAATAGMGEKLWFNFIKINHSFDPVGTHQMLFSFNDFDENGEVSGDEAWTLQLIGADCPPMDPGCPTEPEILAMVADIDDPSGDYAGDG
jgi:Flp pilus assembly pilin Flp